MKVKNNFVAQKGRQRRKYSLCAILCVVGLSLFSSIKAHAEQEERASKIKAATIYYVSKFMKWPETLGPTIEVCVHHQDYWSVLLEQILKGKKIGERSVTVRSLLSDEVPSSCSVVAASVSAPASFRSAIRNIKNPSTLTMCETELVSWDTCMVQIYEESNKARLAIDRKMLSAAGLDASSELLAIANVREN